MRQLTTETREDIRKVVYEFFSEECEVELDDIHDKTHITDDLDGDSLLFVELVEVLKKKYDLSIQLQTIGKYLLKKPAETIGEVTATSCLIFEHENDIVNL